MASVKPLSLVAASVPKSLQCQFFSIPKTPALKFPILLTRPVGLRLDCSHSTLGFAYAAETSDWALQAQEEEDSAEGGVFVEEEEEPAYAESSEEAKIFVGNLPIEVDSERLAMLFEKAGTVELAEVIYNRENDQSRGFGFVTMNSVEEVERAIEMFRQYELEGRVLTVNKANPKTARADRIGQVFDPVPKIYVGNLPWEVDSARLEQVFRAHGKVVNARVVSDRETGRSRGFGFVTMSSEAEVNSAVAALDGQSLDGRSIRVNVAEEKPRRSFF